MSLEKRNEAERAIVSFAITAPEAFAKAAVNVNPTDFVDRELGRLCWVLAKMQSSGIDLRDLNAVVLELSRQGELKKFGHYELAQLVSEGYFPHNVDFYIERVLHYSKLDRTRLAAQSLLDACNPDNEDTATIDQAIADFQATTNRVFKPKDKAVKLVELGKQLYNRMSNPEQYETLKVSTGFQCIDDAAGGFFKGQLALLSGRSFRGKTLLKMNIATKLAKQGYKTAIHNLEMTGLELAERGYAEVAEIPYSRFVQGEFSTSNKKAMFDALSKTNDWPLWIHESTSESIASLIGKIEYMHLSEGLDVVFIDHLQRIENRSNQDKRHHLKDCCHQLKNLARRLNVVVVLLTQLRTTDGDKDEEPTEADYSEAKQIFEEADLAMMLHRSPDEPGGKLIFRKVRKGRTCSEYLRLEGEYQRFYEQPPEVPVEVADDNGDGWRKSDWDEFNTPKF